MALDYPNAKPEPDDELVATRDGSWGHVAEYHDHIEEDETIVVQFGPRLDLPQGRDTFEATVNDVETTVHIDFVTELFQLADQLTYTRY